MHLQHLPRASVRTSGLLQIHAQHLCSSHTSTHSFYVLHPVSFRPGLQFCKCPAMKLALAGVSRAGSGRPARAAPAPTPQQNSGVRECGSAGARTPQNSTADVFPASHWGVPPGVAAKLDNWGRELVNRVRVCGRASLSAAGLPVTWPSRDQLHVGTDCSGAEAPIWALKGMGLSHVHKFSCDIVPSVRDFIQATSPPEGPIYSDMLKRPVGDLPAHSLYCCGFPCKAFSFLRRHSTKLLKEASAKPFFAVIRLLRERRPVLAVLENVRGIQTVFTAVFAQLKKIEGYYVFVLPMDSVELGEPVSRPRFYFILVRQDVAVKGDVSFLSKLAKDLHSAARSEVWDRVSQRMLPADSAVVKEFLKRRAGKATRACGRTGVRACGLTARQMAVLTSARRMAGAAGSTGAIVDVSQSEDRSHPRYNGICTTLTPGAEVFVERAGRVIMPIEKLMLHGFPIHRMKIPTSTSSSQLASLGGNTMHVKCVGLAILIGVCLVNWNHPSARPGVESPATARLATLVVQPLQASEGPTRQTKRKRAASKKAARLVKRK